MGVFAVQTAKGPNWDPGAGIRHQQQWDEHAKFADGLVRQGVFLVGGPVSGGPDEDVALVAVEAADADQVHSIFADDPWVAGGILRIKDVRPWKWWLNGLQ